MKKLVTEHCKTYPKLEIQDIFKFLHQSCFGCGHMVSSYEDAAIRIKREYENTDGVTAFIEPLDGKYSRVSLGWINSGLNPETLAKLFYLSSKKEPDGLYALEEKLKQTHQLIKDGVLPFSETEFEKELALWKSTGYAATHHSDSFNKAYLPSYRVISDQYTPFVPLLAKLDGMLSKGKVKLCIEGSSASGKTTISELLEKLYDCTVFHMDDFFLQPYQRTPERFAQPGGNVDRERFLEEVLLPMSRNETVYYRCFDCSSFKILPPVAVTPKKLVVTEGSYCMHPELASYYDISVFMDISPKLQRERILERNPDMADRFFDEWIPLEKRYFEHFRIKENCDIIIAIAQEQV